MKTSSFKYSDQAKPTVSPPLGFVRKATLFSAATAFALGAFASNAMAVDYYWRSTDSSSVWNFSAKWFTQPTGGTAHAAGELSPDNTYIITNVGTNAINTDTFTNTGANSVFTGGTLVLATAGQLNVRTTGTSKALIANFVTTGGGLIVATPTNSATHNLVVTSFTNGSGTTRLSASASGTNRSLSLEIGTLSGTGDFAIDAASPDNRTIFISATDATAYTGNFDFSRGTINFNNDLVSGGSLTLSGSVSVVLDQNVTFSSVTIAGNALAAGTYSFSTLNQNSNYGGVFANYDAFFAEGGTGSITVIPEPSTYAALFGAAALGLVIARRRRHI